MCPCNSLNIKIISCIVENTAVARLLYDVSKSKDHAIVNLAVSPGAAERRAVAKRDSHHQERRAGAREEQGALEGEDEEREGGEGEGEGAREEGSRETTPGDECIGGEGQAPHRW